MIRLSGAFRLAVCFLPFLSLASSAFADRRGDQGIGVMVGNPTGFSYKIFLDERIGVDAAFGVAQSELDTHVTLLFHDYNLLGRSPSFANVTSRGDLPLYLGIGPRALFEDDDTEIGIRLPVGISYFPHRTPWESFIEIAPVVRLTPETGMDLDFAIGVRHYFPAIRPRSEGGS